MNIILIGFKKSGKTSIGKILSSVMKKKFFDIDEILMSLFEKKYKKRKTIYEVFQILEEKKFRELEKEVIFSIRNINNAIISTGGGSILNNNLAIFEKPKIIIYLKTSKEILLRRIQKEKTTIYKDRNFFEKKEYENRKNLYEKSSDKIIQTDNKNIEKITLEIQELINV